MEFFQNLPTWAAVLLGLLAAVVLVALNIGWLLQARAMLEGYARKRDETAKTPDESPARRSETRPDH
jgi:heme exporter protein D